MTLQPIAPYERHAPTPQRDGGIVWYTRPVWSRADWYAMLVAVGRLQVAT